MTKELQIKKWNSNYDGAMYGLFDGENILYSHFCSCDGFAIGDLVLRRKERQEELDSKYGKDKWTICPDIIEI